MLKHCKTLNVAYSTYIKEEIKKKDLLDILCTKGVSKRDFFPINKMMIAFFNEFTNFCFYASSYDLFGGKVNYSYCSYNTA